MKHSGLFVVFCVLLSQLGACSEEPGSSLSETQPAVRDVPDPAMEQMHEVESRPTAALPSAPPPPPADPVRFTVDLENRRVFLPEQGWLDATAFWDIYYNHPGDLPDEIDHGALEPLRSSMTHSIE